MTEGRPALLRRPGSRSFATYWLPWGESSLSLPVGAKVLGASLDAGARLVLLVDQLDDNPRVKRCFLTVKPNHSIPQEGALYVGTVQDRVHNFHSVWEEL
jgi:hypothetical protein